MTYINDEIDDFLAGEYVDYIGYARIDRYEEELAAWGGAIVRGYRYGISIGIALLHDRHEDARRESDPMTRTARTAQGYRITRATVARRVARGGSNGDDQRFQPIANRML